MFENLPRWPLLHRPGVDQELTLAQKRAARATWPVSTMSKQSHIDHSMYRMCAHERIERTLLAQGPSKYGVEGAWSLDIHPEHIRPPVAADALALSPLMPPLLHQIESLAPLGPCHWRRDAPWHLPLGIEAMFEALEASGTRWMLTGGLGLAAWSRPRVLGGVDLFTDDPRGVLEALGVFSPQTLESTHGLVARLVGSNGGTVIDIWDEQLGVDFEQSWANRLSLSVVDGPVICVLGRDAFVAHKIALNRFIDHTDLLMLCKTHGIIHEPFQAIGASA